MNGLVIAIDRWHIGYAGAYGNTWLETPGIDRLAFEGCVFDQFLIDSPHQEDLYRAYWQGVHALAGPAAGSARPVVFELLSAQGVHTAVVTDEPGLADYCLSRGIDEWLVFDPSTADRPAESLEETHLALCFARLIQWLEAAPQPFFVWCHLQGFAAAWDAPLEWRRRWMEPGDPEPPGGVAVPCYRPAPDADPDELLGISYCYAGQVAVLDACLGALRESLDSSPWGRETLLGLVSLRGFPLGEHGRVGPVDHALYAELVHVPLILRLPGGVGRGIRSQALVQPVDVWATLVDWWRLADAPPSPGAASLLPVLREQWLLPPTLPMGHRKAGWAVAPGDAPPLARRDRLGLTGGAAEKAIRTPAWYLRDGQPAELYVKPDDRWEVNNVADRCAELVDPLRAALAEFETLVRGAGSPTLSPLDDVLLYGVE